MKFLKSFSVGLLMIVCFCVTSRVAFADNSAPVLDASRSPVMVSVDEDAGAPVGVVGTSVTSLVDSAALPGGLDNVMDVDGGVLGIAVVSTNTNNLTCFYSLNGGTSWFAIGSTSTSSARLLSADPSHRIYCQPAADYNGTITDAITFRAWDQSSGTSGGTADTTTSGGTSAFSTATDTAAITVTDTTPPDTFLLSDTPELMVSPIWGFLFESTEDPSTFECSLDSGAFAPCTPPYTSPTLALGLHTFEVRAIDGASLIDATPATASWTVIPGYTLESVSPVDDAKGVSTSTPIIFRFTDPVHSFLREHFTISSAPCDTSCPTLEAVWSENNTVLTYTKTDGPFKQETTYTFRLGNDHDGVIDEDVDYGSFTTRKNTSIGGHVGGSEKMPSSQNLQVKASEVTVSKGEVYHFPRTLKFGLQGDDVVILQKFLGITPPASKHFGLLTKATLISYQGSRGLDTDGIAGPKTLAVIESEMNK